MFHLPRRFKYIYFLTIEKINDLKTKLRTFHYTNTRVFFRSLYGICALASVCTLTIEYGFYFPKEWIHIIRVVNTTVINYIIAYEILSFLFSSEKNLDYIQTHKLELSIVGLVLIQKLFEKELITFFKLGSFGADDTALVFLSINQIFLIFSNLARLFRNTRIYNFNRINPSLVFFLSFASIIFIGTLLLSLPKAQKVDLKLVDIFFTVVSATCVTGLSTIDITISLSFLGQCILLLLIQIGGLGLITLTTFFAMFLAGRASVNEQLLMKDLLSEEALGRVSKIIGQIAIQTFIIESIGAFLLYMNLPKDSNLSFFERVFSSLFHSISAFCNAGFSLFPNGLAETYFKSAKVYLVIIMILITLGGMGFPVVTEISKKIFSVDTRLVKLSILSKFVLLISFIFLLMGSIAYFILEQKYSLKNLTLFNQIFHSVFYSVTTRTAGFNTLSISSMGVPMVFVSFLLMWVGASPNSTGGGIKTSTFAVSILSILGMIKGKDRLEIFKREISPSSVTRASATIVLSLFVIFIAIFSIVLVESFSFLDICYEVVSAYGTVGLTRGITPLLSTPSKIVIAIVMFMGRVGVLTILIAFTPKSKDYKHRYPMEYVVVG